MSLYLLLVHLWIACFFHLRTHVRAIHVQITPRVSHISMKKTASSASVQRDPAEKTVKMVSRLQNVENNSHLHGKWFEPRDISDMFSFGQRRRGDKTYTVSA